jgi:hypothetical protein
LSLVVPDGPGCGLELEKIGHPYPMHMPGDKGFARKKNDRPGFASQSLRRRTDEEIIRLLMWKCKLPAKLKAKIQFNE